MQGECSFLVTPLRVTAARPPLPYMSGYPPGYFTLFHPRACICQCAHPQRPSSSALHAATSAADPLHPPPSLLTSMLLPGLAASSLPSHLSSAFRAAANLEQQEQHTHLGENCPEEWQQHLRWV
jgi:hypothetical protein